ncbi:MAG TPA: hypothetical protein VFN35_21865 [Ktedonobacteraceae bacterium]|nr:hypothetical protein [Ktedonobacteraceae bacterium]
MSMRHGQAAISRASVEQFLQGLSRLARQYSRLYLAGEAALVHLGLRPGTSNDIDVVIETSDEQEMHMALQHCMQALRINIRFSSPEDIVPVPWQWNEQARPIATYGSIETFYFDLPSLALSKIALANERELYDVRLMLQQGVVSLDDLDNTYLEVQPRMGKKPYEHIDIPNFAKQYSIVRKWLVQRLQPETARF